MVEKTNRQRDRDHREEEIRGRAEEPERRGPGEAVRPEDARAGRAGRKAKEGEESARQPDDRERHFQAEPGRGGARRSTPERARREKDDERREERETNRCADGATVREPAGERLAIEEDVRDGRAAHDQRNDDARRVGLLARGRRLAGAEQPNACALASVIAGAGFAAPTGTGGRRTRALRGDTGDDALARPGVDDRAERGPQTPRNEERAGAQLWRDGLERTPPPRHRTSVALDEHSPLATL